MWGIEPFTILVLIPIVFVGIIAVSVIGSLEEKTRGDRISKFFSIASNAAIFFTVIALLYQVIDSEEEAQRTSYAEVLGTYYEITQLQTDHPEVWSLIYPGGEFAESNEEERLAIQYTYFVMNFFERLYLQHRDGVIDDQRWQTWESWIRYSFSASPMFQSVWDEGCAMYDAAFVAYIEENYDDGTCQPEDAQANAPAATPSAAPPR